MKHLAGFLSLALFLATVNPAGACTIVMVTRGKIVLAGNNEDWRNPNTKIWFSPRDPGQAMSVLLAAPIFVRRGNRG
jgi:hypothetical protein